MEERLDGGVSHRAVSHFSLSGELIGGRYAIGNFLHGQKRGQIGRIRRNDDECEEKPPAHGDSRRKTIDAFGALLHCRRVEMPTGLVRPQAKQIEGATGTRFPFPSRTDDDDVLENGDGDADDDPTDNDSAPHVVRKGIHEREQIGAFRLRLSGEQDQADVEPGMREVDVFFASVRYCHGSDAQVDRAVEELTDHAGRFFDRSVFVVRNKTDVVGEVESI